MKTDVPSRVDKLNSATISFKTAIFEGVTNAIQSIQLKKQKDPKFEDGLIEIELLREGGSKSFNEDQGGEIVTGAKITDNGEGFTSENWDSFNTLDSTYKQNLGCKGIGRLIWIKTCGVAEIESRFFEKGRPVFKEIILDQKDAHQTTLDFDDKPLCTCLTLKDIKPAFQPTSKLNGETLARDVLKHAFHFFILGDMPQIKVKDSGYTYNINEIFEDSILEKKAPEAFSLKGQNFELTLLKVRTGKGIKESSIIYCANHRRVKAKSLKEFNVPLVKTLATEDGEPFLYLGLVAGPYLDDIVDETRSKFLFPEKKKGQKNIFIDEEELNSKIREVATALLADEVKESKRKSKAVLANFAEHHAPEFKSFVATQGDSDSLFIDPFSNEKQIRNFLVLKYADFEIHSGEEIDKVIQEPWSPDENPEQKIREIQEKMSPLDCHDLTKFASKRKYYIGILKKVLEFKNEPEKEHYYEACLHSLIYPKKTDSTGQGDKHNLWIIDESLSFYHYIASDKEFPKNKVVLSDSEEAPDIFHFRVYSQREGDENLGEAVFVEFKRPGLDGYSRDPILQMMSYVMAFREGKVKTLEGRPIDNPDSIPVYYYLIADLTPALKKSCVMNGLMPNATETRYYGFNGGVRAFIEVMSFNYLYKNVKERNHALLLAAHIAG